MAKKIVETVQQLIDKTSDRRKLGKIKEAKTSSFKFNRQNLLIPETNKPADLTVQRNNILWHKSYFQHGRGPYVDLNLQDFNTSQSVEKDILTSENGNFIDKLIRGNSNAKYVCRVGVDRVLGTNIRINANQASISVYLTNEASKSTTRIFSSGSGGFYIPSSIPLYFTAGGNWVITILYYKESANGELRVSGDLGSYVHAIEGPQKLPRTIPTINTSFSISGAESKFVDSANGPTLSNIIYWDKLNPDQDAFGGQNVAGYGLYEIQPQKLSYTVVSGWGTDGFIVSDNKRADFPIISKVTVDSTEYTVSGTQFFSDINQTLIDLSGTAFSGNPSDDIYVDRDYHIIDLPNKASLGQIVSGIHYNVIAKRSYSYQVDTYNEIGERGDRTSKISITAGDFTPPGQVTNLVASGTLKAIELSWTNPNDPDLKGIHVWDKDNITSGTDFPIQTLLKGSQGTVPNRVLMTQVSSGTLIDKWPYTFYVSTFDWAGNEDAQNMPSASDNTNILIKTQETGRRVEINDTYSEIRFFDNDNSNPMRMGFNTKGLADGIWLKDATGLDCKLLIADSTETLTAQYKYDQIQYSKNTGGVGQARIYAQDDAGVYEIYVEDSDSNQTKISPHNSKKEWEYFSRNVRTGKVIKINMEKMIRKLQEITGETFIEEWTDESIIRHRNT